MAVVDCYQPTRGLNRSRWQGVGHRVAWRLPNVAVEYVLRVIVRCRVDWGNDAAAMRVVRREIGLPWWTLFCSKLEESKRAAGILFVRAVSTF